jgi:hypothetical protein
VALMPIKTVRDLLVADSAVTALVGARVSPQFKDQAEALPCVTLVLVSVVPQNHLGGAPTLDQNQVQVDSWAATYAAARGVADACRAALETAGLKMENEFEDYDQEADEYRVSQDFTVWT